MSDLNKITHIFSMHKVTKLLLSVSIIFIYLIFSFFCIEVNCSLIVRSGLKLLLVLTGFIIIQVNERSRFNQSHILLIILLFVNSVTIVLELLQKSDEFSWFAYAAYGLFTISTGFFEEFLFRFLIFFGLLRWFASYSLRHVLVAMLITSFVFGLMHMLNLRHPNYALQGALNQVILAFGLGMLFQAVLIRYRSMLVIILLHAAVNFFGMYNTYFGSTDKMVSGIDIHNRYSLSFSDFVGVAVITIVLLLPLSMLFFPVKQNYKDWLNKFLN